MNNGRLGGRERNWDEAEVGIAGIWGGNRVVIHYVLARLDVV